NMIDYMGGHSTVEKIADALDASMTVGELSQVMSSRSNGAKLTDALLEVRINGLHGNIPTQGRNIVGNAANFMIGNAERAFATAWGKAIGSNKYALELNAQNQAVKGMFTDAFKLAAETFKSGQSGFDVMTKTPLRTGAIEDLFGGS